MKDLNPYGFGETQLLSVPYAFFSNSSGDQKWTEENNIVSPVNQESKIHINSSSEINLNSDNIDIGSDNATLKFNFNEVKFINNENLFMQFDSDILDVQGRINSYDPIVHLMCQLKITLICKMMVLFFK